MLKNDRTVALVQWLSWLGSILAVYGIARQLRAPPKGALFAALAFASFPEIVLQSSSTQNDLVTSFFLLCAFVFVGELHSAPAAGSLLAGASLGLAIGTKTLAVVMLPGFGLYILAFLFFQRGFTLRKVLVLTLLCLIGCLALGSYFYCQNLSIHGRATGPTSIGEMHSLDGFEWNVAWSNFGRSLMQFLNPNGIIPPWEPIRQALNRGYLAAADSIFQHMGVTKHLPGIDFFDESWSDYQVLPMHEDWAMFGPIFGWLGLATLFYQLLRPGHLRESVRLRALAFAPIVFWIIVSATLRWQLSLGRLMVPMVAISSPLLASLYLERKRRVSSIWNVLLVGACVSCLLSAVLLNEMKPLLGPWTIWGKDRIQILTRNRPSSETMIRFIDRLGLNEARIGFVPFNADSFEYPLFGKHFERKLIPIRIDRNELLSLRTLPEVNYLLLEAETQEFFPLPQSNAIREKQFGIIGLQPLIDSLRDPKSGWHPVLDVDGFLHLFARREEGLDSSAFYILPEFLPGQWNKWPDHWVKEDFVLHARIDPAKPTLEIGGETPALGVQPTIKIESPDHKPLRTIVLPKSGPFNSWVSLASLSSDYNGRYAALRFTSNLQFNPKKLGLSNDPRDLSWRL